MVVDLKARVPDTLEGAADAVYFGVLNALEGHRLVPGQRLVEADLALQFGVGRNSVREAFQRLAAVGIVEILRHKGAAIRVLSRQDTLDVLDVAERMIGLLARSAARTAARGHASAHLKEALRFLAHAGRGGDGEEFSKARRSFYRALLELSNSQELKRLFPSIQMPIVYAQYRVPGLQRIRLFDYKAIGEAVLAGNEQAADITAMKHVQNVRSEILGAKAGPTSE